MIRRFLAAWGFLTIFPSPAGTDAGGFLPRSLPFFPVVGVVLGAASWLAATLLSGFLPPMAVAAVMTAVFAAHSGGLHLDGLADSADGLFGPHGRERALEIMRDSRIGAMGAAALVLTLLVKFSCLASVGDDIPLVALLVPLGGRSAMLVPMALLPYLRSAGLGSIFSGEDRPAALFVACALLAFGISAFWGWYGVVVALPAWAVVVCAWTLFLRRRLGGSTGDGYGAACEFGETAMLMAASGVFAQGF